MAKYPMSFPKWAVLLLIICLVAACSPRTHRGVEPLPTGAAATLQNPLVPSATIEVTIVESPGVEETPILLEDSQPTPETLGVATTPTQTRTPVSGSPIQPTSGATSSNIYPVQTTIAPTPTRTTEPGWAGAWVVWYGKAEGPFTYGTMTVTVSGSEINAAATIGTKTFDLTGVIYQDGQWSTGSYTVGTDEGAFYWSFLSVNQFGGSLDNTEAFCAARAGISQPDPCVVYSSY